MARKSKNEYLRAIWDRYQRAGRRYKSKILDEFCAVCGYTRKYAIGLLGRKPGRPAGMTRACASPSRPFGWLPSSCAPSGSRRPCLCGYPFYEAEHGALEGSVRRKLLQISAATIDRLLKKERARYRGKGLCGTRPGGLLKHQIPSARTMTTWTGPVSWRPTPSPTAATRRRGTSSGA